MRYTEQIKYSWGYHWGIFCEIWDIFTLHKWRWIVVGLLLALSVIPVIVHIFNTNVHFFIHATIPPFNPNIPQDIGYELALTNYYAILGREPHPLVVINYFWVRGSGFMGLTNGLCSVSITLLMVAYLREGSPAVRGREEQIEELSGHSER